MPLHLCTCVCTGESNPKLCNMLLRIQMGGKGSLTPVVKKVKSMVTTEVYELKLHCG